MPIGPAHGARGEEADADAATLAQQQAARALLSSGQALFLPVTVIEALPNRITQIKSADSDGYRALQVAAQRVRKGFRNPFHWGGWILYGAP